MYAGAMLLLVFNSHMGPQCIVGVGVAERSHLLQDNSNVLSRERMMEGDRDGGKKKERRETEDFLLMRKLCNNWNRTCIF